MRSLLLSLLWGAIVWILAARTLSAAPLDPVPALLRVTVPADAVLTIHGHATQSLGTDRAFVSPPLLAGKSYHYLVTAEFIRGAKTITVEQDVVVRAGRETFVSLGMLADGAGNLSSTRGNRSWYGADSDTRSYYNPLPAPARAAVTPFPFASSEDRAARGNRSSSAEFRGPHWGTDSSDPFRPGSEW